MLCVFVQDKKKKRNIDMGYVFQLCDSTRLLAVLTFVYSSFEIRFLLKNMDM